MSYRDRDSVFTIVFIAIVIIAIILFSVWRYDKCVEGGLDPAYCVVDACS